jgi:hypothetical protein
VELPASEDPPSWDRKGADQSARIATVSRGTVLRKVEEQKQWVKVIVDNSDSSETGWIYSELVEEIRRF